jgi:hypothetical protein
VDEVQCIYTSFCSIRIGVGEVGAGALFKSKAVDRDSSEMTLERAIECTNEPSATGVPKEPPNQ